LTKPQGAVINYLIFLHVLVVFTWRTWSPYMWPCLTP